MKKLLTAFALLAAISAPAWATEAQNTNKPINIGEMMSYTGAPEFSYPFREGWQMALDDFNESGGVDGRKIEVISRDDHADPAVAVRLAEDLVFREKVVMLIGGGLDHVGLAISSYAKQQKISFIKQWGSTCDLFGMEKNPYWFATMECIDLHAYVYAEEAAKLPYKRWATIAPNYQYGRTITAAFKTALKKLRPDVEFVSERYPTLNKINAQEEIRAIQRAKPDAVFNQLFTSDLPQYIRAGEKLGFIKGCFHMADLIGSPQAIRELGDSYPDGWFTIGVDPNPDFELARKFSQRYEARYHKKPDDVAFGGYKIMQFAVEALRKAHSTDPEKITEALRGLMIDSPKGPETMRANEQQAYDNYWVGYTKNEGGKGQFTNIRFVRVDDLMKKYNLKGQK
ncbi:MAG: ABC transporter substrate-binding protein [Alphaproteobacteria bacterium]|nr:ABC transporter substrate-binding protein [Alphaproteobacteria bacterium]